MSEWDGENYVPSCQFEFRAGSDEEARRFFWREVKFYDCEEYDVRFVIEDETGRPVYGVTVVNDFSMRTPDVYS
jgi:hypothetical protein